MVLFYRKDGLLNSYEDISERLKISNPSMNYDTALRIGNLIDQCIDDKDTVKGGLGEKRMTALVAGVASILASQGIADETKKNIFLDIANILASAGLHAVGEQFTLRTSISI